MREGLFLPGIYLLYPAGQLELLRQLAETDDKVI
jgi:hypothetical protein